MADKQRLKIRLVGSKQALKQASTHLRLLYEVISESKDYPRRDSVESARYLEVDVEIEENHDAG